VAEVVVDEGMLIRGLEAEDPASGLETECADVLFAVQTAHRWVFHEDLVDVYLDRLFQARYKGVIWRGLQRSLQDTIVDKNSGLWLDRAPVIEGPYHRKDQRWVSAAAAAPDGCRLITLDERLVKQLRSSGLPEQYGFVPCLVPEALVDLGADDA
jgi:hypothetical protein